MLRLLPFIFLFSSCSSDETISGYADRDVVYRLDTINGAAFGAEATIAFPEPRKVTGNAPCNSYNAAQTAPYPWFDLGPIAATRRACPALDLESVYFDALAAMTLVEVLGNVLILSNDAGAEMVFQTD